MLSDYAEEVARASAAEEEEAAEEERTKRAAPKCKLYRTRLNGKVGLVTSPNISNTELVLLCLFTSTNLSMFMNLDLITEITDISTVLCWLVRRVPSLMHPKI